MRVREATVLHSSDVTTAPAPNRAPGLGTAPLLLGLSWPLVTAALVLYGSFIPFNVCLERLSVANAFGLAEIQFRGAPLDDLLTNLLLYVPVGATLALSVLFVNRPRALILLGVAAWGFGLSTCAEALQAAIPERVASWTDVILNGVGAAFGASMALSLRPPAERRLSRWRAFAANRPFAAAAWVMTVGLVAFELAPFDFLTSTDALHEAFRRAVWHPLQTGSLSLTSGWFSDELAMALWFGVLGYLFALGELEVSRDPRRALLRGVTHLALFAGMVELLQLFTATHVLMTTSIVVRTIMGLLGAWAASYVLDGLFGRFWRGRPRVAIPTVLVITLAALHASVYLLPSVGDLQLRLGDFHPPASIQIPFEMLWRGRVTHAASEVLCSMIGFGTLALLTGISLRRLRVTHAWWFSGLVASSLALCGGIAGAIATNTPLDPTPFIIAVVAAAAVADLYPRVRPAAFVAGTVSADDVYS